MASTSSHVIDASTPDTGIRFITLNRPQKRNALSRQLIDDFLAELRLANKDPAVRVIVISGAGSFFSGETFLVSPLSPIRTP
jgi:enoyl-CoA hydratase